VDGVEVSGHPGVVDQVSPGQGDGSLRQKLESAQGSCANPGSS
jgi:hypothetical protein